MIRRELKSLGAIRPLLLCFAALSMIVLGGCAETFSNRISGVEAVHQTSPSNNLKNDIADQSEELLGAKGHWNLVEQGRAYDPAQAHLHARNNVNIKRRKKRAALAAHFEPDAISGKDGKIRVLKLEPSKSISKNRHEFSEMSGSTMVYPAGKVIDAVGETSNIISMRKISGIIVPPTLPETKQKVTAVIVEKSAGNQVVIPRNKPTYIKRSSSSNKIVESKIIKPSQAIRPRNKPKQDISASNHAASLPIVKSLRSGSDSGRARIVIELTSVAKYKVAIDQFRNILRIKINKAKWNLGVKGILPGSSLLGSYIVGKQRDGSVILEVSLKHKSKILDAVLLRPNKSSKYRIVVDLQE